jgi:hypothetical protein
MRQSNYEYNVVILICPHLRQLKPFDHFNFDKVSKQVISSGNFL